MAKFIYSGPMSGVTLKPKKGSKDKPLEVMFHNGKPPLGADGKPVDLDESNPYVKMLKAKGHLKPAPKAEPASVSKTDEPPKTDEKPDAAPEPKGKPKTGGPKPRN